MNALARHPVLIPYAAGLQTLDTLYLDTTFAIKSNIYGAFPSKADGIKELLEKVRRYPEDTIFYLRAWTFGYEDVWQALSAALMSKVRPVSDHEVAFLLIRLRFMWIGINLASTGL